VVKVAIARGWAPLFFFISIPDLVIECKGGVIVSFPALNARSGSLLEQWLSRIGAEQKQPRPAGLLRCAVVVFQIIRWV
jgi:hypothetical protein